MTTPRWLLSFVLAIGLSGPALASPETPSTVPELVAAVQKTYTGVKSVRADFVQTLRNPLSGKEEKKRGRIAMERPRKMRIEVGVPILESAVVSDGLTLWIYAAAQKQVIVQKEQAQTAGMGVLLDDLGRLGELFDVRLLSSEGSPSYVVQLSPKTPGQYKTVQLTLTKPRLTLQQLVLVDQMDTRTQMDFSMVTMNVDVPDALFAFKAPPGTAVIDGGKL